MKRAVLLLYYRRQLSFLNTYYVPGTLHSMGNIYCLPTQTLYVG